MNSCMAYKDAHNAPQQSENVYDDTDAETMCDADAEALYDNISI